MFFIKDLTSNDNCDYNIQCKQNWLSSIKFKKVFNNT